MSVSFVAPLDALTNERKSFVQIQAVLQRGIQPPELSARWVKRLQPISQLAFQRTDTSQGTFDYHLVPVVILMLSAVRVRMGARNRTHRAALSSCLGVGYLNRDQIR